MAPFIEIEDGIYAVNTQMSDVFVRSFIIHQNDSAVIIDTGLKKTHHKIVETLKQLNISNDRVKWIVNTHSHHDHIGANCELKEYFSNQVIAHRLAVPWIENHELQFREFLCRFPDELEPNDEMKNFFFDNLGRACGVDRTFESDIQIHVENRMLKLIHTPGHSADSISVFDANTNSIITGDSLMGDGVADTIPQYDCVEKYCASIEKIRKMNVDHIFTAHFDSIAGANCRRFLHTCEESVKRVDDAIREITFSGKKSQRRLNIARQLCHRHNKRLTIQTLYTVEAHLSSYHS